MREHIAWTTKIITIDFNGYESEVELDIKYRFTPECKGGYQDGLQVEPDEPASIEILGAEFAMNRLAPLKDIKINMFWLLTESQLEGMADEIMEEGE